MYYIFNDRLQFIQQFDTIEEASDYLNEHEPKNELWTIEELN